MASCGVLAFRLVNSAVSKTLNYVMVTKLRFVINKPLGIQIWMLMMLYLWTRLRVSFNAYMSILVAI
jgi:hypothetical protein